MTAKNYLYLWLHKEQHTEALCELVIKCRYNKMHIEDTKDVIYYVIWYGIWHEMSLDSDVSISERNIAAANAAKTKSHVLTHFARMKNWSLYTEVLNALYGYNSWQMPEENARSEKNRMKTDI